METKSSSGKLKMMSNKELAMFCDQMAMIIKAGQTPEAGINLMLEDAASDEARRILEPIAKMCDIGEPFHRACAESGVFPKYALDMMEIGNTSGKLDDVLESLANHYNREEAVAQSIKSAVTYPFLIICMMLIVILVLVIKVLPIFQQVFIQLGTEMTGFSKNLLNFGNTLSTYSAIFIGLVIVIALLFLYFTKFPAGKKKWSLFCAKCPLTRGFYEKIAAGRFASAMAIMKAAGLDTDKSLDLTSQLVDNEIMIKKIDECRKLMDGDENHEPISFSESLAKTGIFSAMYSKMVNIGFKSGSVDKVFKKIADSYDEEIDNTLSNTISILEPTLVIILSIVVCLILLSVIMPLMGIMSSIG
ncbi:MAG: type II secretion system F family protein [Lachnospiraceae bacterium]|nr:type II secretion system F family protein [Lachnospiraceae bacterium]